MGTEAWNSFMTGFGTGSADPEGRHVSPTGAPAGAGTGPMDSLFTGYGTSAAEAFKTSFNTGYDSFVANLGGGGGTGNAQAGGPFNSTFSGYGISAAQAFQTAFESSMAGWSPNIGTQSSPGAGKGAVEDARQGMPAPETGGTTITIKVELDKTAFESDFANLNAEMLTFTTTTYKAKLSADRVEFAEIFNPCQVALNEFAGESFEATLSATRAPADAALNSILQRLAVYDALNSESTISASRLPADQALNSILQRLNAYAASTYSATISVIDNASAVIADVIDGLNTVNGKQATATVTTINRTINQVENQAPTTTRNAAGGVIDSSMQIVGERGIELTHLPKGTRVQSSARTMNMLRDAMSFALRTSDPTPPTASAEFRNARQWMVQSGSASKGDVNIRIDNLNVSKDVDVDRAVERIDRLSGRRMEMLRRGMGTFEESRTL
jgi:hypothetical protein